MYLPILLLRLLLMGLCQRVCHLGVKAQLRWLSFLAHKLGPEYEPEPELEVKIARRSTSVVLVPAAVQYYSYIGIRILTSLQCLVVSHLSHLSRHRKAIWNGHC